jgi:hypothetical protein
MIADGVVGCNLYDYKLHCSPFLLWVDAVSAIKNTRGVATEELLLNLSLERLDAS